MRILFVADRSFSRRERAMLRRLEVGLIAEGISIIRMTPASLGTVAGEDLTAGVEYQDRGSRLTLGLRARRALRDVQMVASEQPDRPFDAVHAWGPGCWAFAREMAIRGGAHLVVEVWSAEGVSRAAGFERSEPVPRAADGSADAAAGGAPDATAPARVWNTAAERVSEALEGATTWPRRVSPWGVHIPEEPIRAGHGGPIAACVISSGRSAAHTLAFLEGVADLGGAWGEILLFMDAVAVDRHVDVWKRAEQLGLLGSLSVIADMESRRALILKTDLMVHPEPLTDCRSVLLDAMASGMTLVAGAPGLFDAAVDDETAVILRDQSPDGWAKTLSRIVEDEALRDRIGGNARAYIKDHRLAHAHVQALASLYRSLDAEPIKFAQH